MTESTTQITAAPSQLLAPSASPVKTYSDAGIDENVAAELTAAGFTQNTALQDKLVAKATEANLSHNGEYRMLGVYSKDTVTLSFEQNTSTEDIGGLSAAISHPSVCVVSGPLGRATCNASDAKLILSVASDLG